MALPSDRLTAEQFVALSDVLNGNNPHLLAGLRAVFAAEEHQRLDSLRAEALGQMKVGVICQYAAESRVFAEWEGIVKRALERMAPQRR